MKKAMKKKMTEKQREEWFEAARNNDIETVQGMIEEGIDVKTVDEKGWTSLHTACYYGYIDIAKILIDNGADVIIKDKTGTAPLHLSCYWGDIDMIGLLLGNSADITARDDDGYAPLDRLKGKYPKQYEELIEWLTEEYPEKALEVMASENIQCKGVEL